MLEYNKDFGKFILGNETTLYITTSSNVNEVQLYLNGTYIANFLQDSDTSFRYNISGSGLELIYSTGDLIELSVLLIDYDTGASEFVNYTGVCDFTKPVLNIKLGNSSVDYSQGNYAVPWTPFEINTYDGYLLGEYSPTFTFEDDILFDAPEHWRVNSGPNSHSRVVKEGENQVVEMAIAPDEYSEIYLKNLANYTSATIEFRIKGEDVLNSYFSYLIPF